MHKTGHTFREEDIAFLDRGKSNQELRVKEGMFVRVLEPSLNGAGGLAYDLPHTYDRTLKKIIKEPKVPPP